MPPATVGDLIPWLVVVTAPAGSLIGLEFRGRRVVVGQFAFRGRLPPRHWRGCILDGEPMVHRPTALMFMAYRHCLKNPS